MIKIKRKITKLLNYIDLNFQKESILAIFIGVAYFLYIKIFNLVEIYENSLLENLPVIPLIIGGGLCFRAKKCKVFFRILGFIIIWIILREFSYGRVFFAQIPGSVNDYYPLSHYKYGYLIHLFVGIYLGAVLLYGIINKVWLDIIVMIKKVKFPLLMFLLMFFGIIIQIYSEKQDNTLVEETIEAMVYCLILGLIIFYQKKLKS